MVVKSFQLATRAILYSAGYRWELRRKGELKIGLWRKRWKRKNEKKSYLKRFVLLPGFGDSPVSWFGVLSLMAPILRSNFDEVVLIDFPGSTGRLFQEKYFDSMDRMMEAIADVLDTLRPDTLVGHSLGGWLAAHYATSVRKVANYKGPAHIVLINPSGVFESPEIRREWMEKFRPLVEKTDFAALRPYLFAKEPLWFRLIANKYLEFMKREDIVNFMLSVREDHSIEDRVSQISARVTLIWGEKDTLLPPTAIQKWMECLNGQVRPKAVLLKGVGHSPQVEKPIVTATVLAQLIRQKELPKIGDRWWAQVPEAVAIES